MLRNFITEKDIESGMKKLDVMAIDNQLSEYRTTWISDTIITDGVKFLTNPQARVAHGEVNGGRGCILLLVYPQATGGFTEKILRAFKGDVIVVAGTQNSNGFTGFQDRVIDEWVEREMPEFELVLRIPLPSFAGKDEGLFVWKRKNV